MKIKLTYISILAIIVMVLACKANKEYSAASGETVNKKQDVRIKIIEDSLKLTEEQLNGIKDIDSIVNEVYLSIRDTLSHKLIKQNLDSFYAEKYTVKELTTNLELYRIFKGDNISIKIQRDLDPNKVPSFDNIEDLKKFLAKYKPNKINTETKVRKDTIHKKKRH